MFRFLAIAALCACSSGGRSDRTPTSPGPAGAPALQPSVTMFVSPNVGGILRAKSEDFPIIAYVSSLLPSPPPCWTQLRSSIDAGYQLETRAPASSYFILDGNLPRPDVERCVREAFASVMPVTIERDGELAVFRTSAGTAYAGWRGSIIVIGTKDQVTGALGASTPESYTLWRGRLAQLPDAPLAMWRQDALLENLFGVAVPSYVVGIDARKTPKPWFEGRVIARYATAGDAAIVARRIRGGELQLPIAPPAEFVAALKRMRVTQDGETLELGFALDTFVDAGVELEKLQAWLVELATAQAAPPQ